MQAQNYFSKIWEVDGIGPDVSNSIMESLVVDDTLYYLAFHRCVEVATIPTYYRCGVVGKMDMDGNILQERNLGGHYSQARGNPMIYHDDKLYLIGRENHSGTQWTTMTVLDAHTLDSLDHQKFYPQENVVRAIPVAAAVSDTRIVIGGWVEYLDEDDDSDVFDYLLWIDAHSMELDTVTHYPLEDLNPPYESRYILPEKLFWDAEGRLVLNWAGLILQSGYGRTYGFSRYVSPGEIDWQYIAPTCEDGLDIAVRAEQYANGDLLFLGQGSSCVDPDPDVVKDSYYRIKRIDNAGNLLWTFDDPGWGWAHRMVVSSVSNLRIADNGDVLLCGGFLYNPTDIYRYAAPPGTFPPPGVVLPPADFDPQATVKLPYVARLDGQTGELLWHYAIMERDDWGNPGPYHLYDINELSDGTILATGYAADRDSLGNFAYLPGDSWAIRMPADGCNGLVSGEADMLCDLDFLSDTEEVYSLDPEQDRPFVLFPNPTTNEVYLRAQGELSAARIRVLDQFGRELRTAELVGQLLSLSELPSGMLFLEIYGTDGELLQLERVVKL